MESKKSKAENGLERERGGQKGNRNAAKVGDDLRFEMYLSKPRRMFFEEWFLLKFGRLALLMCALLSKVLAKFPVHWHVNI